MQSNVRRRDMFRVTYLFFLPRLQGGPRSTADSPLLVKAEQFTPELLSLMRRTSLCHHYPSALMPLIGVVRVKRWQDESRIKRYPTEKESLDGDDDNQRMHQLRGLRARMPKHGHLCRRGRMGPEWREPSRNRAGYL